MLSGSSNSSDFYQFRIKCKTLLDPLFTFGGQTRPADLNKVIRGWETNSKNKNLSNSHHTRKRRKIPGWYSGALNAISQAHKNPWDQMGTIQSHPILQDWESERSDLSVMRICFVVFCSPQDVFLVRDCGGGFMNSFDSFFLSGYGFVDIRNFQFWGFILIPVWISGCRWALFMTVPQFYLILDLSLRTTSASRLFYPHYVLVSPNSS